MVELRKYNVSTVPVTWLVWAQGTPCLKAGEIGDWIRPWWGGHGVACASNVVGKKEELGRFVTLVKS